MFSDRASELDLLRSMAARTRAPSSEVTKVQALFSDAGLKPSRDASSGATTNWVSRALLSLMGPPSPIFETVFQWPGLGRVLFQAVGLYDTAVIVGSTVIFAYMLAVTVFLLDFVYALVDPRVKVGGGGK